MNARPPLFLLALLGAFGCQPLQEQQMPRGEVGVFYGGQVQRRLAVSVAAASAPKIGFRLSLPAEHSGPWHVAWHVVRPGPLGRRVTQVETTTLPAGHRQFDQLIEIPPDGPLGTYNVRVVVDDHLVIDRALVLRPDS